MPADAVRAEIEEVAARLRGVASTFDPAVELASDLAKVVEVAAEVERLAAGVRIQAAARVAESGVWKAGGDRSADEWMARLTRSTIGQARSEIGTGERLKSMPRTAEAVRAGTLSPQQANEVTSAVYFAPDAEGKLLEVAENRSLRDLKDAARAARQATEDDAARNERIRRNRYLRTSTDGEGAFCLSMRGPASDGARLLAALRPFHAGLFDANRRSGDHVGYEATAFDALCAMASAADAASSGGSETNTETDGKTVRPRRGGRDVKVIVRIDLAALLRGHPVDGETVDIAGVGPVPVTAVRELLPHALLAAVVTNGRDVHTVAHLGRGPSAHQLTALEWLMPTCTVASCARTVAIEYDHRTPWTEVLETTVSNLDGLCRHHHSLKTRQGYRLEPGTGPRRLLPPGQPP